MKESYFDKLEKKRVVMLDKLPTRWRLKARIQRDKLGKEVGYLAADSWLGDVTEGLNNLLNIAADDGDIQELAKALAFGVRERGGWGYIELMAYIRSLCEGYAVPYPAQFDREGILARVTDDVWWLRKLRTAHAQAREQAAIRAGLVHKHNDVYCSDDTLERRTSQLERNRQLLANIEMQSESGQVMNLADIAKSGMANQDNRRAELMTRISGFEQLADEVGHKAVFVTLTCPSRMHAIRQIGKFKTEPNPKYDGTTPKQAQDYLVDCWQKARRWLGHNEVKFYGLRVAEPHHDATPHWHLILWCDGKPSTLKKLRYGITRYFVEADREEIWNDITPRVKFVEIKASKGTATGYVVKYVSKNLGGIKDDCSDEAENKGSNEIAPRVEAWASTWHIRQFQQIGGHFVSVWRELRRVTDSSIEGAVDCIARGWKAAQKTAEKRADFAEYIKVMGGLYCPPSRSVLMVDDDFVMKRGRYGETAVRVVKGVRERFGFGCVENNREKWERVSGGKYETKNR